MTPNILLKELKSYIEGLTATMALEYKQAGDDEYTAPKVYTGKLPVKSKTGLEYVPYILIKLLTGEDVQTPGQPTESTVKTRIILTTYSKNPEEGYMDAVNIISRIRTDLLTKRKVGGVFKLNMPVEYIVYEVDIGAYTVGEIVAEWSIPPIEQEFRIKGDLAWRK